MLSELLEEGLAKSSSFHEQAALSLLSFPDEHRHVHDVLVDQYVSSTTGSVEGKTATANPLGLLTNEIRRLSAD
jgi:hypothetical protein